MTLPRTEADIVMTPHNDPTDLPRPRSERYLKECRLFKLTDIVRLARERQQRICREYKNTAESIPSLSKLKARRKLLDPESPLKGLNLGRLVNAFEDQAKFHGWEKAPVVVASPSPSPRNEPQPNPASHPPYVPVL